MLNSTRLVRRLMSSQNSNQVFTVDFVEVNEMLRLELNNRSDQVVRQVEILTIFLKAETSVVVPSAAHIKFEVIETIRPGERVIVRHRTWEGGKPIALNLDQLNRLELVSGEETPYILDLSWQDPHGKTRFQRISVGH